MLLVMVEKEILKAQLVSAISSYSSTSISWFSFITSAANQTLAERSSPPNLSAAAIMISLSVFCIRPSLEKNQPLNDFMFAGKLKQSRYASPPKYKFEFRAVEIRAEISSDFLFFWPLNLTSSVQFWLKPGGINWFYSTSLLMNSDSNISNSNLHRIS